MKEVTRAQGTDQKKLISQISEEQKSNPLLLNLLKMADRAGMAVMADGEGVPVFTFMLLSAPVRAEYTVGRP